MMSLHRRRWLIVALAVFTVMLTTGVFLAPTVASQMRGDALASGSEAASAGAPSEAANGTSEAGVAPAWTPSTSTANARPTVAVRRGSISEQVLLGARVAALEEASITFPVIGRVEAVFVKPGDIVEEGQNLVQADTTELLRELSAARARVELGTLRHEQTQAQAQARQRQAEHAAGLDRTRRESAVVDAESAVRRAQEDLARVKQGAPVADRRAAEASVVSARASLESAEAELARASVGASEVELKTADQAVWAARLAHERAKADFDRVARGADPAEVRAAEREVAAAQTVLDRARMDFDRLLRGDPTMVAAAEREVQRAQLALRTAESTRIESGSGTSRNAQRAAREARDASIASARLAIRDAQDRLTVARRGPEAAEVEMARRTIQSAQSSLQTANERLEQVRKGPDELALSTANQAVDSALIASKAAEGRYLELAAGPPPERVAAARNAVQSARAGVASAMDRVAELANRPTRAELRDAEERVATAQVMLERVQAEPPPVVDDTDPGAYDRVALEKSLEQDRDQVATLEQQLAGMMLKAPYAGVVSSLQVRPGDPVDRGVQVLALARPGDPIVHADVGREDGARMAIGQRATIQAEGMTGTPPEATVIGLVDGPGGIGQIAQLKVTWNHATPAYGTAVQALVTVQEKDNVLLIPQRSVKTSGQRRYVEYLEGDARRTVDVSLGIAGAGEVEVLSGLRDGQLILAGTTSATPGTGTPASAAPSTSSSRAPVSP